MICRIKGCWSNLVYALFTKEMVAIFRENQIDYLVKHFLNENYFLSKPNLILPLVGLHLRTEVRRTWISWILICGVCMSFV